MGKGESVDVKLWVSQWGGIRYIELRIGGTGPGSRYNLISSLKAKEIGYKLLLEAEKLDAKQRKDREAIMKKRIAKKADQ